MLSLLLCIALSLAAGPSLQAPLLKAPVFSSRCQKLLKKRDKELVHKQKLMALFERNVLLDKNLPLSGLKTRQKLKDNRKKIKNLVRLSLVKIRNQEENIIKKGCPGIRL